MIDQDVPVQITVIAAEPGWSAVFIGREEYRYLPVIAWEIRSVPLPRGVPQARAVTVDGYANHSCTLLSDPQGVFRLTDTAFETRGTFATVEDAWAYLQLPHDERVGLETPTAST